MSHPNTLRKTGVLIMLIGAGAPCLISLIMILTETEYILGLDLTVFVFSMVYVFLIGGIIILFS